MSFPADTGALARELDEVLGAHRALLEETPAFLGFRPAAGGWTAAEVVEHVSLTNHFLLLLADKLARKCRARRDRGEPWPAGDWGHPHLEAIVRHPRAWEHPEHMTPRGRRTEETRAALAEQATRARDLLTEFPGGQGTLARIRISVLPPPDDRLDLYQLLAFLGKHAARHLDQVARLRADYSAR